MSLGNVGTDRDAKKEKGDSCQHPLAYPETDNFDSVCRKTVLVRLVVVARCNFAAIYRSSDIAASL